MTRSSQKRLPYGILNMLSSAEVITSDDSDEVKLRECKAHQIFFWSGQVVNLGGPGQTEVFNSPELWHSQRRVLCCCGLQTCLVWWPSEASGHQHAPGSLYRSHLGGSHIWAGLCLCTWFSASL